MIRSACVPAVVRQGARAGRDPAGHGVSGAVRVAAACAGLRHAARHGRHGAGEPAPQDDIHLLPPHDVVRRPAAPAADVDGLRAAGAHGDGVHRLRGRLRDGRQRHRHGRWSLLVGRHRRVHTHRHHPAAAAQSAPRRRSVHQHEEAAVASLPVPRLSARWRVRHAVVYPTLDTTLRNGVT